MRDEESSFITFMRSIIVHDSKSLAKPHHLAHTTVLQDGQFAALKEREYFKPKKSPFWSFLIEKYSKIHKIGDYCGKKLSKFEENSKNNIYSLVPQIGDPVALCTLYLYEDTIERYETEILSDWPH